MHEGSFARIAVLQPHDGDTTDFEAGYVRHLDWHRQNQDSWSWYGWTVWAGDRQRYFIYGTFGHSAASLDAPVDPAGDERDNIVNVTPHGHFAGHALYEFLPSLSRGTGVPAATARMELATVELTLGAAEAFEESLAAAAGSLRSETLWYRMIAGGASPRYVRLRPRARVSSFLEERAGFPTDKVARSTIEILTLRPAMCYGVTPVV